MERTNSIRHIAVFGAGAIGCYVGAAWAEALSNAGVKLTLIGRLATLSFGDANSVVLSGVNEVEIDRRLFETSCDAADLCDADIVFIATKATALKNIIADLKDNLSDGATIISLMNGLEPVRQLREAFPQHDVLAGMVPFNVVWKHTNHLHCSSAGSLALESSPVTINLAGITKKSIVPLDWFEDLKPIQYGKLLLNLINPINALSGLPLHAMLSQRMYRKIYAATLKEALSIYDVAAIDWQKVGPISPRAAVRLLPMPDVFFNNTLLKLQKLDESSMTSMATDLQSGKPTEIAVINEEVVRIAASVGASAPINARIVALIRKAEGNGPSNSYEARELADALGL